MLNPELISDEVDLERKHFKLEKLKMNFCFGEIFKFQCVTKIFLHTFKMEMKGSASEENK